MGFASTVNLCKVEVDLAKSIKDGTVVYLKKHLNGSWVDSLYLENGDVVLKYQNCFGQLWESKVKPALIETSNDTLIAVQTFPLERHFYVTKRTISPHGKGFSTFTVKV